MAIFVENYKDMETIYDHNPTKLEVEKIGYLPKELYLKLDADTKYRDLALLFNIRGDKKKMKHYISLVRDDMMRNSFFRTIYHP